MKTKRAVPSKREPKLTPWQRRIEDRVTSLERRVIPASGDPAQEAERILAERGIGSVLSKSKQR